MEEPVRILHILQRMEAGGTQALLMNLYRNIDRKKIQFDFLVVYREKQFYDKEIEGLGGKIYKFSFREDLNIIKFKRGLRLFFETHKEYKIVHCHAYTFGFFCLKEAEHAGIPVRIAHSHSNSMTNDFKKAIKKEMQLLFVRYANEFFACSKEAGDFLFKDKEYIILKNAIDSNKFTYNKEVQKRLKQKMNLEDNIIIGHVGRFKIEKNHIFLLEVFKRIKQEITNAKLILIGDGPEKGSILKKIDQFNLNDDVVLLGNISNVNEVLQVMDLFIFPSKYEGLGIVAIESQAAGVPILASSGVPKETVVTDIMFQLNLHSGADTWARKACELLSNGIEKSDHHQQIIQSGYDLGSTTKIIEEYYLSKINGIVY